MDSSASIENRFSKRSSATSGTSSRDRSDLLDVAVPFHASRNMRRKRDVASTIDEHDERPTETALDKEYLPRPAFCVEDEYASVEKIGMTFLASGGLLPLILCVEHSEFRALTFLSDTTFAGVSGNGGLGASVAAGDWGGCAGSDGGRFCTPAGSGTFAAFEARGRFGSIDEGGVLD